MVSRDAGFILGACESGNGVSEMIKTKVFIVSVCFIVMTSLIYDVGALERTEDEEARKFYTECMRFDYCGNKGVILSERGFPKMGIFEVVLKTPEIIRIDKMFYEKLMAVEEKMVAGSQITNELWQIGGMLLNLGQVVGEVDFWQYVSSVEYSIIRVMSCRDTALTINEIDHLLPNQLFDKHCVGVHAERSEKHRAFKNMIIVSSAIRDWHRNHRTIPKELGEMCLDAKYFRGVGGAKLEYQTRGDVWQLFSPGAPGGRNKAPFNEYVPVMDAPGIRFWPFSSCLWLSSDYADKRRELYEKGRLYSSGKSKCACKLERGQILPLLVD